MNAHTPGPWTYAGTGGLVGGPDRIRIADCNVGERSPEARQANARLIAAAPDLLAALRRAQTVLSDPNSATTDEIWDEVVREVGAVLRKAEGQE